MVQTPRGLAPAQDGSANAASYGKLQTRDITPPTTG